MPIGSPTGDDSRLFKAQFPYIDVRDGPLYAPEVSDQVGWNASATGFTQMPAAAKLEFLPTAATVGGIVGIASAAVQDYGQLTHAIYVTRGVAQALQAGALIGSTTSFVDNDVFAINVDGSGVVTYQKNGTTFYTSTVANADTAHVITAFLYAANDAIYNLVVTPATIGDAHATGTATTRAGTALGASTGTGSYCPGYARTAATRVYGYSGLALHPTFIAIRADTPPARLDAFGSTTGATGYLHTAPGRALGADIANYATGDAVTAPGTAYGTAGVHINVTLIETLGLSEVLGLQNLIYESIISSLRFNEAWHGSIVLPQSIISSLRISHSFTFLRMLQSIIASLSATDLMTPTLALPASVIAQLGAQDQSQATGQTLHAFLLERAGVRAVEELIGATAPHETWVVNTEKSTPGPGRIAANQSTRYDDFDFNSFCVLNGMAYGARADGVYRLDGENDAGASIRASMNFGKQRFGTSAFKAMPAVYVGTATSGALFLKVVANAQEYIYKARSFSGDMATQRFDLGRGLRANYLEFELFNGPGSAFELETIEFAPVPMSRRI